MNIQQLGNTPRINELIQQICNWNAKRYDQKYDHPLTMKLLSEEFNETVDAFEDGDKVEIADGLADIFYVAIGALWKQGMAISEIPKACTHIEQTVEFLPPVGTAINWHDTVQHPAILTMVAVSALQELISFAGSPAIAVWVIKAVCDSNDTKEVVKTDPSVKANVNKGKDFVDPKARIKELLHA